MDGPALKWEESSKCMLPENGLVTGTGNLKIYQKSTLDPIRQLLSPYE